MSWNYRMVKTVTKIPLGDIDILTTELYINILEIMKNER
jgi:hypothetical protein